VPLNTKLVNQLVEVKLDKIEASGNVVGEIMELQVI
jgi:hypothetical protein